MHSFSLLCIVILLAFGYSQADSTSEVHSTNRSSSTSESEVNGVKIQITEQSYEVRHNDDCKLYKYVQKSFNGPVEDAPAGADGIARCTVQTCETGAVPEAIDCKDFKETD